MNAVPGRQQQGRPPARRVAGRGLAPGISAANSNTRISAAALARVNTPARPRVASETAPENLGLNSERMRTQMVARLREQGITDTRVLAAMQAVPRHRFVDEGLASRAYEDAALPIGHAQTISQPWVVARMISVVCERDVPARVLEVGAGCGYQAAVLAQLAREVYAIERIGALVDAARLRLAALSVRNVRLAHGDGMKGWPAAAPFDAIIVAAAGLEIPPALLAQLAPHGRLIAPEGGAQQKLILVERTGAASWQRTELDPVRFVPLRAGLQS